MHTYMETDINYLKNHLNEVAENFFTTTFTSEEERKIHYEQLVRLSEKVDKIIVSLQKNSRENLYTF